MCLNLNENDNENKITLKNYFSEENDKIYYDNLNIMT